MTFHVRTPSVGSRSGPLAMPHAVPTPRIRVFDCGPDACRETTLGTREELPPFLDSPEAIWVNMDLRNTEQHVVQTRCDRPGWFGTGRKSN